MNLLIILFLNLDSFLLGFLHGSQAEGFKTFLSNRFLKKMKWFKNGESTRQLPPECIADCSGSGDVTSNVEYWVNRLEFDGPKDLFKEYLEKYGAWDDEQLKDHDENKMRVLWSWACDCSEDPGTYDYLYLS